MLGRVGGVGIDDVLYVGLAVGEIESFDTGHGGEEADDGFIGVDVGHGFLGIDGVGVDAEFLVDEAFDAGLETVFEAVFAGGDAIINSAAGEVLMGKNQGVHLGVNGEIVFHRALGESHFGLLGTLD